MLERRISEFLGTEGTILYSSCFDANGGLFETLLSDQDAVISDELNHASIIDGIRLCKAARFRYKNNDMEDLEEKLKETQNMRFRMIATDGVFSMDGIIADLIAHMIVLSPAPWEKRWEEPAAAMPAGGRRSSSCCGSGQGPTFFPIRCLLLLPQPPFRFLTC